MSKIGFENLNESFFDTIRVKAKKEDIISIAEQNEINFYYPDKDTVSISINETTNLDDLNDIFQVFKTYNKSYSSEKITLSKLNNIPKKYSRESSFMEDEVFQKYHSETKLMRYIKSLENKDLALNRSMISLGSCTMKLNAASQMLPLSWNRWGNIHPLSLIHI